MDELSKQYTYFHCDSCKFSDGCYFACVGVMPHVKCYDADFNEITKDKFIKGVTNG